MKSSKAIYKYSKITPQKKFHLLTLVLNEKMLIKNAAKIVGINYSTAKTILFFHRNGEKSYQFEFKNPQKIKQISQKPMASFVDISLNRYDLPETLSPTSTIDIISTVGSRQQAIQAYRGFNCSKNSIFFEKKSISQDVETEKREKAQEKMRRQSSIFLNSERPMTRAEANRLSSLSSRSLLPPCKIEQEESHGGVTVKQQNF